MLSPGFVCRKSLKTAACFQTSSSGLPSMTGGLSNRGMRTGWAFSGGITARFAAAESDFFELDEGDFAGLASGEGAGVAALSVAAAPDCAATGSHNRPSAMSSSNIRLTLSNIQLAILNSNDGFQADE